MVCRQFWTKCLKIFQENLTGKSTSKLHRLLKGVETLTKPSVSWATQWCTVLTTSSGRSGWLQQEFNSIWENMRDRERSLRDVAMKSHPSRCLWPCLTMQSTSRWGDRSRELAKSFNTLRELPSLNGKSTWSRSYSRSGMEVSRLLRILSSNLLTSTSPLVDCGPHSSNYSTQKPRPQKNLTLLSKLLTALC